MLRLSLWRLGGAVTRASAAAAKSHKPVRAAASTPRRATSPPRRATSPPRRGTSPSSNKVGKRAKTPVAARGRPRSAGRGRASSSSPPAPTGRGRGRSSSTRAASRGRGRGGAGTGASKSKAPASRAVSPARASAKAPPLVSAEGSASDESAPTRPAGMSAEREKQVLDAAARMQSKDVTTDVPVASFAYEVLKAHPSVRSMGLRERMDFLLHRWSRLSKAQKLEYVNDPLRGLL